ncbi:MULTISPECIES: hypothetical protein [unclassified Microcoleus]|uniref:hypothetical protein n=1 Tax=unclassified Microcoleus TaxID=2642155 RepID=UPI002FD3166E
MFAVCRFSDRLESETSIIRKPLQIEKNGKWLQHTFSVLSLIYRMIERDAVQVLRHGSKSRNLTKDVRSEAKR